MTVATLQKEIEQTIVQEPMVGWFNPGQLVRTAIRALLGTLFGAYTDRRELQAALQAGSLDQEAHELDYSSRDELWIDYVADLGDGWDSTYSIAWLLSQESLRIGGVDTPRGQLLVMGGDQVYPTATRETYQNRFKGPYTAALPWLERDNPDLLYAIPGNHDWYDGLSSFLKLFCQQRWIGGRRTRQHRSYFALQLPHRWWLWAVDIQLEADIDEPQKRYFEYFAEKLKCGDRVILCTAVSSWVDAGDPRLLPDPDEQDSHPNLIVLEDIIRKHKAEVVLSLAGDLHHYSHYVQSNGERHKFTAGGGGAFLRGTHDLPEELNLTEGGVETVYRRVKAYPDDQTSQRLRWGNLRFFYLNPSFSLFVGFVYLCYAWIWQSASKVPSLAGSLMERLSQVQPGLSEFFCDVLPDLYRTLAHHPGTALVTLFLPFALCFFANPPPRKWAGLRRIGWGVGHGVAHLFLGLVLLWVFARLNLGPIDRLLGWDVQTWMDSPWQVLLFTVEMLAGGFLLGGVLTGLYLVLSNALSGLHASKSFSSLHIPDYKNFLRLHLGPQGLQVFPVAVERACREWQLNPAAKQVSTSGWLRRIWKFKIGEHVETPWFAPAAGGIPLELIEGPVHIPEKKEQGDAEL